MKPWMAFGVLLLSLALSPLATAKTQAILKPVKKLDVDELNKQLEANQIGWTAKESSVTALTPVEWRGLLGAKAESQSDIQFESHDIPVGSAPRTEVPSAFDWRNKDGINWVSPILNQGNCGSCVAFAAVGTLETLYRIDSQLSSFNVEFSPQSLFSCGGGACDDGWEPQDAAEYLMKKGVPDESCLPYTSGLTGKDVSCQATCHDAPARSVRIATYTRPTKGGKNIEAVKAALMHGPLVTTMDIYSDFMAYGKGIYKHFKGDQIGSHAISIVGYNDFERSFTMRNSWGPDWGEHGFARISYDDISGLGNSTWLYYLQPVSGVSLQTPRDQSYFTGIVPVGATATVPGTKYLQAMIYDGAGRAVMNEDITSLTGQTSSGQVGAQNLPNGRYELAVAAFDALGKELAISQHRYFYLINKKPSFTLKLNGPSQSSALHGSVPLTIRIAGAPVPLTEVEFHYRLQGDVERIAQTASTLDGTTLTWRTKNGANGQYEIWLTGKIQTAQQNSEAESAHLLYNIKN